MAKFGLSGKSKKITSKKKEKKKGKKAEVSPLMAEEEDGPKPSSSRAEKDEKRKRQRAERDERRKEREKRVDDSAKSKSSSKGSKKSKSRPKLSREEQDAKDAKLGCCHKFAQLLVKIIHLIDGIIGIFFIVYGSLIMTNFKTPAMEAVITSLSYGSIMLLTAIMGVIGFYTGMCRRIGLAISAYMGIVTAFFYVFIIIAMLSSSQIYFNYLEEHKDVLYLNDAEINILKQMMPFFYILLASLAAVEVCRFFGLRQIRATLMRYDSASQRISSRLASGSKGGSKGSSKKSSKTSSKSGSSRSQLSQPLIKDEEFGESDSSDEDWGV